MNTQADENDIKRAANEALNEKADALDGQSLSKLNRARQRALSELDRGRRPAYSLPLAGATAAAVVLAMVFVLKSGDDGLENDAEFRAAVVDDFELLMAEDGIEILEDLEFYELLDSLQSEDEGGRTIG